MATRGHLGGADEDLVEVIQVEEGHFFQSMTLTKKEDNFSWCVWSSQG